MKIAALAFLWVNIAAFAQSTPATSPVPHYVGSLACKTCHPQVY